jgi:twitching motility protein PilT
MGPKIAPSLDGLLMAARNKGASDLILSATSPPMLRLDGQLRPVEVPPLDAESTKSLVYGLLTNEQIAAFEKDKELDFSFTFHGEDRMRCNVFFQRGTVGAAFRIIPSVIPTLEQLSLPPIVGELALIPQGLILVTGPTGHGKSTTQACMIDIINHNRRMHIVTIEDPIEFVHSNLKSVVEQREVGDDTHSFPEALRHVLRQNPDVILVGEMRDPESIATALTAAETGHLVISTLHTNDSVQAVDRIIDSFPPHQQNQIRSQLALCLQAVIAQRLLPRADGKGRIVAVEMLRNNFAVSNNIREEKTHQLYGVLDTHAKDGMRSFDRSLKELYLKGVITFKEAQRRMRSPQLLKG